MEEAREGRPGHNIEAQPLGPHLGHSPHSGRCHQARRTRWEGGSSTRKVPLFALASAQRPEPHAGAVPIRQCIGLTAVTAQQGDPAESFPQSRFLNAACTRCLHGPCCAPLLPSVPPVCTINWADTQGFRMQATMQVSVTHTYTPPRSIQHCCLLPSSSCTGCGGQIGELWRHGRQQADLNPTPATRVLCSLHQN